MQLETLTLEELEQELEVARETQKVAIKAAEQRHYNYSEQVEEDILDELRRRRENRQNP